MVYSGSVWVFTAAHAAGAWTGEDAEMEAENRTALWVEGMVERNTTDDIIDPGTPVGNIETAIANCTTAAASANAAASAAQDAADAAEALVENWSVATAAETTAYLGIT